VLTSITSNVSCRGVGEGGAGGAVAPPLLKACPQTPLLNSPPIFSTCSYPSELYLKYRSSLPILFVAGSDYTAVGEVRPFPINGDDRVCVEVSIIQDEVIQQEYYEVFLVRLTSSDAPVIVPQAVVVILDQG